MVKPEKAAPVTRTILRTRGPVSADSLRRDGTAQPVSQDQIQRRERGQGKVHFPCSADHNEQDWQPHPVDPYSAISDGNHTRLIHTLTYTFIHIFYSHDTPRYYRPPDGTVHRGSLRLPEGVARRLQQQSGGTRGPPSNGIVYVTRRSARQLSESRQPRRW